MAQDNKLHEAYRVLLKECLIGVPPTATGTWFIQGRQSLMESIAEMDAVVASRSVHPELQSIAAHLFHCLFVLRLANASYGGQPPTGTWEQTWDKQMVTEEEWQELTANVASEVQLLMENSAKEGDWSDEEHATSVLTALPHLAFHLGAIRQLIHLSRSQNS